MNENICPFPSEARTATSNSIDFTNFTSTGCHVVIDVTAVGEPAPSVVFTLQGKDTVSGKYYTILASPSISTVGTTVLKVFKGATASANAVANDLLPRTWRIIATHGNANSITYSVGVSLV